MPDVPAHAVRPPRLTPRFIDECGFIRLGRRRALGERSGPPRLVHIEAEAQRRIDRVVFLGWVHLLLPLDHPSGFEDIRGACCGK